MKKLQIAHAILTAVVMVLVIGLGYVQYRAGGLLVALADYLVTKEESRRPCVDGSADARTLEAKGRR